MNRGTRAKLVSVTVAIAALLSGCDGAKLDPKPPPSGTAQPTGPAASTTPATSSTTSDRGNTMATTTAPSANDEESPAVVLDAAPRYYIGLPIVVSVTFENRSKDTEFYDLPPLGPLLTRANVGLTLMRDGETTPALSTRFPRPEEDATGITLATGDRVRGILDLSNLGVAMTPGKYTMTLSLYFDKSGRPSNGAPVELVALSDADAAEAARLRKVGTAPVDTGAWAPFLRNNWSTPQVAASFAAPAKEHLLLHLFLHRAFYGPEPVSKSDPSPLDAITLPSHAAEVLALKYELLAARKDPGAKQARDALLQRFPAMQHRARAIDTGEGTIAAGRKAYGREKQHIKPPPQLPYSP